MFKYLFLVVVLLASLVPINTSQAQDGWSLYFHDYSTNEIVQVNADGTQTTYPIQLSGEREVISTQMIVKNGKAVFCTDDLSGVTGAVGGGPGASPNRFPTTFYIQDLATGENVRAVGLGAATCHISTTPFNADGSQVSFSTLDPDNGAWQLLVIDMLTGVKIHELNTVPDALTEGYWMPSARYLGEDSLSFAMLMWHTEGAPVNPAYTWNLTDNSVVADAKWGQFNPAYLSATGEMVMPAFDNTRPAGNPGGPMPSNNIVRYLGADGTESVIFYSGEMLPTRAVFIDNGNALAINLMAGVDPANGIEFSPGNQWIRLDRDGTITPLTELSPDYILIMPIPNGYVVSSYIPSEDGGQTVLSFYSPELTMAITPEGHTSLSFAGADGFELNPTDAPAFTAIP